MQTAKTTFTVKSATDEGVIIGIASTPTLDVQGDTIDPMGAQFTLPMPLLHEHDPEQPIGMVERAEVTPKGIQVTARIAKDASQRVKDVWQRIKGGLSGLSVGFLPIEKADTATGRHFQKWRWCELSVVGIPANPEAGITVVKSASSQPQKENPKMNIQEQIQALETKKAGLVQTNADLVTKSAEMSDDDAKAYDANKAEVEKIDKHLARLRETEAALATSAVAVNPTATQSSEAGTQARQGQITVKSNLPKGTAFVRYAAALARGRGNLMQAAEIAKGFKDTPEVETVLKAAVAAGTTTDATWAKPLVEYQVMTSEFIELLRPETLLGKIEGFRRVPFNIKFQSQTAGATVNWVGEGKYKPVSKLAFATDSLGFATASGIIPITEELARFSSPAAEALIAQDLRAAMVEFLDTAFIDPSKAGVSGISPASITNGLSGITPGGKTLEKLRADVRKVFDKFIAAKLDTSGCVWIMSPSRALALSMMYNEQGLLAYPNLTAKGGTFHGLPVVTSSLAGNNIIMLSPGEIFLADDGDITLDASREASLLMSDDPETDKASMQLVSLWQAGMIGFKADRVINWKRRRFDAVAIITNAQYGE